MNYRSQNRLAVLRRYLDSWAARPRCGRAVVAEIVVEAFKVYEYAEHLAGTGVEFTHSDDVAHDMRVHGQKLWRWIGAFEDCKPQPDKLFYVEQAVVAAMPEDLRTRYLSEVYQHADLCICMTQDAPAADAASMIRSLIKENAEAQIAVSTITSHSTHHEIHEAIRELRESEAISASAIRALEGLLEEQTHGR